MPGTVYSSYPILPFGIVGCTFFSDSLSRNSCMCYKSTGSPAFFFAPSHARLASLANFLFLSAPLGKPFFLRVFISVYHSFPPEPPLYPPQVYTSLLSVCDEFNNPMTARNCISSYLEMASVFSSVINSLPKLPVGLG